MNILVSANNKYLQPLHVMLTSLLKNNSYEHHDIWFLNGSASEEKCETIKRLLEAQYDCTFRIVPVNAETFHGLKTNYHFSIEVYYRLLAQIVLPETVERVLWLDADMIVKGSLRDFYYQDFGDCYLAVCRSINEHPEERIEKLQCPEGTVYFNSGIILFDLARIRRDVPFSDYLDFYEDHMDDILWPDQDILNGLYARKTKINDYRIYNYQVFNSTKLSRRELRDVAGKTIVIHYIGGEKPWHKTYTNPLVKYWRQYERKTRRWRENLVSDFRRQIYRLRVLHGRIEERKRSNKKKREFRADFLACDRDSSIVIGTPSHQNIGDCAIAISESDFLEKCGIPKSKIRMIPVHVFQDNENFLISKLLKNPSFRLFLHGGGNMGDQWYSEELFRRDLLRKIPDAPVLMFPQTIYYSQTENGRKETEMSRSVYDGRAGLTLIAREAPSYQIMRALYPDTETLLVPDIVLSMSVSNYELTHQDRSGALLCIRADFERSVSQKTWEHFEQILLSRNVRCRRTDMDLNTKKGQNNYRELVRKKLQEFCDAELVITDRLHGMVFAAVTGTPCIVLSNYNHKIRGTYEWIKYLPYVKYAESAEEAEALIPALLEMKDCQYDSTPLQPYFDRLKEAVIQKCR